MSNVEASKLYETIIDEVINDSRQDFEDLGIDETVLQELRRIWCEKLSQTHVAHFLLDDDIHNGQQMQGHIGNMNYQAPHGMIPPPPHMGLGLEIPGNDTQFLYQGQGSLGLEIPNLGGSIGSQDVDNSTGLMLPRINQTDGTFELTMELEHASNMLAKWKKLAAEQEAKKVQKLDIIRQADGTLEEEEELFNESDDINSDLDDGLELEKSDDEDGDAEGQIMLCLYDRVQRVKNKWKCNLKEGIANIDGKDYVFQKATGELEW